MNSRQSYIEALTYGNPDKIPLEPGNGRESTLKRWHQEGLPKNINEPQQINYYAYQQASGKEKLPLAGPKFQISHEMIPEYERKVLEKKETSQIVQDWKGNIVEISNEYTVDYLGGKNSKSDFVTRRWIKCPVTDKNDWKEIKRRYDPSEPARLPANAEQLSKILSCRDYFLQVKFNGPYWQLREWLGFEELSIAFYDQPNLVMEMIEFWQEYIAQLIKRTLEYVKPDCFHISEDMAYKGFSMLSPQMCRKFLLPCWNKWGELIRNSGVPIYAMDSDGYIGELIPLWIECGINVCDPIEVAAGNDLNKFSKEFGKNMAYRQGIDKRCIAEGGDAIVKEIQRLRPVIQSGGFIPGCDHGVPHDISWDDYVRYVGLLAKETGWL